MRSWITASVVFSVYVIAAVPVVGGLPARSRMLATAGSLAALVICLVAYVLPPTPALHTWVLPPLLLLLGYWCSGLLFVAPMPAAERVLERFDQLLRIDALSSKAPRGVAELLESAYVGVYPLIPLALAVYLFRTPAPDPDRFWTVILITDFLCFAFLPWVQTRTPRAVRSTDPWVSRVRRFNLQLLGRTSIQVNTFPSGHAAEGLVAALLVLGAPWPWTACVGVSALLISLGTVLGRYHYALDAIAGWVVAIAVWWAVR
jgi:membrane-associated phospholipid phosphatase